MTSLHGIEYKGRACFPEGTHWCLVRVGTSWAQVPGHTKGEAIRAAKRVRKAMRWHKGREQAPSRAAYWRRTAFMWLDTLHKEKTCSGATPRNTRGFRSAAGDADAAARYFGFYLP